MSNGRQGQEDSALAAAAASGGGTGAGTPPRGRLDGPNGGWSSRYHASGDSPGVIIEPLELEDLHPRPSAGQELLDANPGFRYSVRTSPSSSSSLMRRQRHHGPHVVDQLWRMIRLFMELHPIATTVVLFGMLGLIMHAAVATFRPGLARHELGKRDYTHLDLDFNFRASQIGHWCLFGDDDECPCEDFIDPVDRAGRRGWKDAQWANVARIDPAKRYDVVFLGDETTEIWNGRWLNINMPVGRPVTNGRLINEYWNATFTKEGGGKFEGLALGITGDSVSWFALLC